MKNKFKNMKGITLIALIITIIVLLILAGVVINMTLGNNGIIQKGQVATEMYAEVQAKEELMMALSELKMDKNMNKNYDSAYAKAKLEEKGFTVEEEIITVGDYKFEVNLDNFEITDSLGKDDVIRYNITLDLAGGTGATKVKKIPGETVQINSIPTPQWSKHTFSGWKKDGTLLSGNFEMPESNIILVATWKEDPTYTISFNSNGGSECNQKTGLYVGDAIGDLPIPNYPGHQFEGWFLDNIEYSSTTLMPNENIILVARYTLEPLRIITVTATNDDCICVQLNVWPTRANGREWLSEFGVSASGGSGAGVYLSEDTVTISNNMKYLAGEIFVENQHFFISYQNPGKGVVPDVVYIGTSIENYNDVYTWTKPTK